MIYRGLPYGDVEHGDFGDDLDGWRDGDGDGLERRAVYDEIVRRIRPRDCNNLC